MNHVKHVCHWCRVIWPFTSWSQKCWTRLRSGLCAGQSGFFTPNWESNFFIDLALCTGALSRWNRKGLSLNCCHKVGSTLLSKILHAVALRFPLIETKGQKQWKKAQERMWKEQSTYFWPCSSRNLGWWRRVLRRGSFSGLTQSFVKWRKVKCHLDLLEIT